MAAFFSTLLPWGTTMTAVSPTRRAANATLWPWLPRVAAITPARSGCCRFSSCM